MSRIASFTEGTQPVETLSLMQRATQQNSMDPRTFRANGLNQPLMHSPMNGNSATDANRQTPSGQLPDSNGMSMSTYHQINPLTATNLKI